MPHIDVEHAAYIGWIMGLALRQGLSQYEPVIDDDGRMTDRVRFAVVGDGYVDLVIPPPPDGWSLTGTAP